MSDDLDELEGQLCAKCERIHPGPDYNGQVGYCLSPWGTDPECQLIYIRRLESRISALETLAHAAIELRSYSARAYPPAEVTERFDAAVKGAGL